MAEGLGGSATTSAGGGSFEMGLADGGFPSSDIGTGQDTEDTTPWNRTNIESCDNNVDEVVCPYATFQFPGDQQSHQQQVLFNFTVKNNPKIKTKLFSVDATNVF